MTTEPISDPTREPERRAKHPAMAARILATGLAVSTTLGLTSLYGLAARAATPEPEPIDPGATVSSPTQPLPAATPPVAAAPPKATLQSTVTLPPATPAPTSVVTAAPVVVAVPVPAWTPPQTSGSK